MDGPGAEGAELAGDVIDVVAALGDRQRDDSGGGPAHEGQNGLGVVGGEAVVVNGADDHRVAQPTGVLADEGVEVALALQRVAHPCVPGQQADTADPPLQAGSPRFDGLSAVSGAGPGAPAHEPVEIGGLVGTVKPTHADVDDPSDHGGAVIVGGQGRLSQ